MYKKASLAFVTSLMLLMGSLYAETVAWYRFDDQAVGTKTQGGVAVANCAGHAQASTAQ